MSFTRFNLIMDNALPDKPKRVFFRIPAKLLAQILVDGYFYKEVQLDEISTTGLSFYLRESEDIPENFEVSFRLSPFSRPVKIKVEVKNRTNLIQGLRIGCIFLNILDADKNLITSYIVRFTNLSLPIKTMNIASFLCLIDSLWRIAAFLVYYRGAKFEKVFQIPFAEHLYFAILLFYALCAAVGFFFSERITNFKEKRYCFVSIFCFIAAFIFILIKNIVYFRIRLGYLGYPSINIFFLVYGLFSLYIALSIGIIIRWLKNIDLVLDMLAQHRLVFTKEG